MGKTFLPVFLDFPSDKSLVPEAKQKRNKELAEKYAVRGFPTVLLLDAQGKVLAQTGYQKGGPEKYLAHIQGLVKNGPLLQKHIKPYEAKIEAVFRKLGKEVDAAAEKAGGDNKAKEAAAKAAVQKLSGATVAELTKLRREFDAEKVPDAISHDKAELLKRLDGAIDFLTKASKGQMP